MYTGWCAQEDALGLEAPVATGEAEEHGEGVAGRQQGDDKDGEHRVGEAQLGVFGIQAGQDEVAASILVCKGPKPSRVWSHAPCHDHPRRRHGDEAPVPRRALLAAVAMAVDGGIALVGCAHCVGGMRLGSGREMLIHGNWPPARVTRIAGSPLSRPLRSAECSAVQCKYSRGSACTAQWDPAGGGMPTAGDDTGEVLQVWARRRRRRRR